jgi:hypothetical protein
MTEQMWQTAPFPVELKAIVETTVYLDWSFTLDFYEREVGGEGLTLRIRFQAPDHCDPNGAVVFLIHDFEVPARVLDAESWQRWVFDCIMLALRHEAMEDFRVGGKQVFFPEHKSTSDMYETKHVVHRRSIGGGVPEFCPGWQDPRCKGECTLEGLGSGPSPEGYRIKDPDCFR